MRKNTKRSKDKKKNPIVVIVIFIPVVIWLAKNSHESYERRAETYRKDQIALTQGVQHEGSILDKRTGTTRRKKSNGSTSVHRRYFLDYRIALPEGALLEDAQRVDKGVWQQFEIGDKIEVAVHDIDDEIWNVPSFKEMNVPKFSSVMIAPTGAALFGIFMFINVLLFNRALDKKKADADPASE